MHAFLDTLIDEHERILDALTALHDFARFFAANEDEPRAPLREFVAFFREYVDEWHHHKEEDLLFEALFTAGFPKNTGPVACMNHEHVDGRAHVQSLATIADGEGPLSVAELASLVEVSADYARLLANHIAKENQMLYPMAQRALGDDALDVLAARVRADRSARSIELERSMARMCATFTAHRATSAEPASAPQP